MANVYTYKHTYVSKDSRIRFKTVGRISRRSFPSHNWFSNTRVLGTFETLTNAPFYCARTFPDYRARFCITSARPLIFNRWWDHCVSEKRTRRKRFGNPQLIGRTPFHFRAFSPPVHRRRAVRIHHRQSPIRVLPST